MLWAGNVVVRLRQWKFGGVTCTGMFQGTDGGLVISSRVLGYGYLLDDVNDEEQCSKVQVAIQCSYRSKWRLSIMVYQERCCR